MTNRIDLDGKVAVVTGGRQGIGEAIARRFAESGARVVIWDRDGIGAQKTAESIGAQARGMDAEITDIHAVEAARDNVLETEGQIDILVNNAGIAGPNALTWDYPVADWNQIMAINLTGTFHCCRAIVPAMIRNNYGRIVNIASVAGKEGNPSASAYSASKAGVIALTKSLGKELAEYDISVNCITPAAAKTPIFDQMSEEHIGYMLSKIPRRRFVMVDEIAALAAFAASAECSFTTGAVLDISGGRATY
ncbi:MULTISPECIES: SDR family NAD(P)-dependent oxidoreductase [Microbaculum]|uniref:SDR family oxidoreductase n=1 Tax=Microbaculum marinisediminis TaxID=2931392 RepID=A0AAW5QYG2_9HYPH|nr:SDR family NAD(P)-dependent oxidoreductase [Microbaculum sp. A6E488]MCT8973091.1 SDR family oxidoreductase [Microbaculum sp. A6E488]